jgi:uncharacterized membrane protein YidH (DUF202 family)
MSQNVQLIIGTIIAGAIGFWSYSRGRKYQEDERKGIARIWMVVSVLAGVFAILSVIAIIL